MKKLLSFLIFSGVLSFSFQASAAQKASLDDVLKEIMQSQSVDKVSSIACAKVNDTQFEALGEALMSVMHPDETQHSLMDQMMGGEGSATEKAAHIWMAKQYLGCVSGVPAMGMMGSGWGGYGMMGSYGGAGGNGYHNMMQNGIYSGRVNWFTNPMMGFGYSWGEGFGGLIIMVLFWLVVIVGIIVLIKWASGGMGNKDSLRILKERYAKGEIKKEEFDTKKKELQE